MVVVTEVGASGRGNCKAILILYGDVEAIDGRPHCWIGFTPPMVRKFEEIFLRVMRAGIVCWRFGDV